MRHRFAGALVALIAGCHGSHSPLYVPQPVNPDHVQRACAMEVSCLSPAPLTPGGSCVTQFETGLATGYGIFFGPSATDLSRYVDCANAHGDCASALDCASGNHGPDWCDAHPQGGCEGDTLISCVAGWGLEQRDCTQLGMHCATTTAGASCTDGNSCDPQTSPARCDGNRFVDCNGGTGLESAIDCTTAIPGGTCQQIVSGSSSSTGCRPPPSPGCGVDDSESCDGTALVGCSGGAAVRVDCTQFGSHCVATSTTAADCVPDGTECTDQSSDSCVGGSLQLCVNGRWGQTDCTSIGFHQCTTTPGGASLCAP